MFYTQEPESMDKSPEASLRRLGNLKVSTCSNCQEGVKMCKHCPCIGTPQDIHNLIHAGFAGKLMLDHWSGHDDKDDVDMTEEKVEDEDLKRIIGLGKRLREAMGKNPFKTDIIYLKPAKKGSEGQKTGFTNTGQCTLLRDDDTCSLHDIGLKPLEGKLACCMVSHDTDSYNHRYDILRLWETDEAKELINNWKKLVNYNDNDNDD